MLWSLTKSHCFSRLLVDTLMVQHVTAEVPLGTSAAGLCFACDAQPAEGGEPQQHPVVTRPLDQTKLGLGGDAYRCWARSGARATGCWFVGWLLRLGGSGRFISDWPALLYGRVRMILTARAWLFKILEVIDFDGESIHQKTHFTFTSRSQVLRYSMYAIFTYIWGIL